MLPLYSVSNHARAGVAREKNVMFLKILLQQSEFTYKYVNIDTSTFTHTYMSLQECALIQTYILCNVKYMDICLYWIKKMQIT